MGYKIENVVKDPVDARDKIAGFTSTREFNYDLLDFVREIENQENIGSCVGHSGVSALELMAFKRGRNVNLSRLFAYYNVRLIDNRIGEEGAYIRSIMKSINKWGLPPEEVYPYITAKENIAPSKEVYDIASRFKVTKYERVPLVKESISGAIDSGYPIVFSMNIFDDFFSMCPTLDATFYKAMGAEAGGHAMVIVGYNKAGVIVENSWGKAWGYNGLANISWGIFFRDAHDAWIATEYVELPPKPVTPVKPTPKGKTNAKLVYFFNNVVNSLKKIFGR